MAVASIKSMYPLTAMLGVLMFGWMWPGTILAQQASVQPDDFFVSGEAVLTSGNCFQLTNEHQWSSGGVWHKAPIDLSQPFTMELRLMFGCDDMGGADGIVFVFTPIRGMVGYQGEGMGFAGLRPALGIEIDTWENEHLFDPPEDHIAILQDGYVNHYYNLAGPQKIPNVEDCALHDVLIQWEPGTQLLSVHLDGREAIEYKGDIVTDIFRGNATVYWGVTAATGRYFNRHAICFDRIEYAMPLDGLEFPPGVKEDLQNGKVMTLEDLKFGSGRSQLLDMSLPDLHRVINFMEANPALKLTIEGHTDNVGSEDQNQRLSLERATAVANYLKSKGVPASRVQVKGYGEEYPRADNDTPGGREQNRRVDIYFFKPRT